MALGQGTEEAAFMGSVVFSGLSKIGGGAACSRVMGKLFFQGTSETSFKKLFLNLPSVLSASAMGSHSPWAAVWAQGRRGHLASGERRSDLSDK